MKIEFGMFKKYNTIFGKAGEGVHKYKFKGTAMVDYVFTILLSMFVTYFTDIPLVITTIVFFFIGIFMHYIFGIRTEVLKFVDI